MLERSVAINGVLFSRNTQARSVGINFRDLHRPNMSTDTERSDASSLIKNQFLLKMDEEEKWTQKIKNRDFSAFFPFAVRIWKYSIANGLYPSDVKVLKKDYAKSFHFAQYGGLAAIIYWNIAAMRAYEQEFTHVHLRPAKL